MFQTNTESTKMDWSLVFGNRNLLANKYAAQQNKESERTTHGNGNGKVKVG